MWSGKMNYVIICIIRKVVNCILKGYVGTLEKPAGLHVSLKWNLYINVSWCFHAILKEKQKTTIYLSVFGIKFVNFIHVG